MDMTSNGYIVYVCIEKKESNARSMISVVCWLYHVFAHALAVP